MSSFSVRLSLTSCFLHSLVPSASSISSLCLFVTPSLFFLWSMYSFSPFHFSLQSYSVRPFIILLFRCSSLNISRLPSPSSSSLHKTSITLPAALSYRLQLLPLFVSSCACLSLWVSVSFTTGRWRFFISVLNCSPLLRIIPNNTRSSDLVSQLKEGYRTTGDSVAACHENFTTVECPTIRGATRAA